MVFAVTWAQKPVSYGYRGDAGTYSENFSQTWPNKMMLVPKIDKARISIATDAEARQLESHHLIVDVDNVNDNYKVVWMLAGERYEKTLSKGTNTIEVNSPNVTDFYLEGPTDARRGSISINSIKINNISTTIGQMEGFATFASNVTIPQGKEGKLYLNNVSGYKQLYVIVQSSSFDNGAFELVWKTNGKEKSETITNNDQEINCGNNVQEVYLRNINNGSDKHINITGFIADNRKRTVQATIAGLQLTDRDVVWTFSQSESTDDSRHTKWLDFERDSKNMVDVSTGNRQLEYYGNNSDTKGSDGDTEFLRVSAATTRAGNIPTQGYFKIVPNVGRANICIYTPAGNDAKRYRILDKNGNQKGEYSYNTLHYIDFGINTNDPNSYNDFYYICFDQAIDIYRIQLQDYGGIVPTITDDLEQVYNVRPGQIIEMPVSVAGQLDNYSFQWYKSNTKTIVGATPIAGATSNIYLGRTSSDGRTAYYFCIVTNKYNPGRRYSNIAIVTTTQTNAPSAPDIYYEYMQNSTKVSLFNNGNYAPIRYTIDGSDPTTSATAMTLSPYDGVNAFGSMEVSFNTTIKAYCPKGNYASGNFEKDSYVKTMEIPVLNPGEAVVSWKHKDTWLNTNSDFLDYRITASTISTESAQDFNCHNLTMTKMAATELKDEEHADYITFRLTRRNNGNTPFDIGIMEFRINKTNRGQGCMKYSLTLHNSDGSVRRRFEDVITDQVVDKDLGWTDFYMRIPMQYGVSEWRLQNNEYAEFTLYGWDLEPGEGIGLASITCFGQFGGTSQHSAIAADFSKFNMSVGETHDIIISTGSDGAITARSLNESVATVGDFVSTGQSGEVRTGRIRVTGVSSGIAGIVITQAPSNYTWVRYEEQQLMVNAYVSSSGSSQEYHIVNGDEVYSHLGTTDLIAQGAWINYSGTTGYTDQEAIHHIDPTTDARSTERKSINLARLAPNDATQLDFYVEGAKSIAVYAQHNNAGDFAKIKIQEDEKTPVTFNNLKTGIEGNMCCLDLSDNGQHRIRISNPDRNLNVYVYGVKLSDKLTPNLTVNQHEVVLWMDKTPAEKSWTPALNTDYSTTTGGNISLSIPDSNPYVSIEGATVTAKAAGNTYLYVRLDANGEYRATSRSVELQVKRNAEAIITQKTTWDLTQGIVNNDEKEGLYWNAQYGVVDDTDKNSATYTRLKGLLICNQSSAHFNLPAGNEGGVLSVTYGPRERHTTTSLRVNLQHPKSVLIEDEWIRTRQQSWTVLPGTTVVSISMGMDFNEGVITSITWTPGSAHNTPQSSGYPMIDNTTGTNAEHGVLSGDEHAGWSLLGQDVYHLLTNREYHIEIPSDACVKKIVVRGTSEEEYDASVIDISNCTAESGQALASCKAEPEHLEFVPTRQTGTYNIRVSQQHAYVNIEIHTYDTCRIVANITEDQINGDGRLGTICFDKDIRGRSHNGALYYKIAYKRIKDEKKNIVFEEVEDLIAGHPYVYIANDYKLGFDFTSDVQAAGAENDNGLIGLLEAHTFTQAEITTEDSNSDPIRGLYGVTSNSIKKIGAGSTSSSGRAFIKLSEVPTYEEYLGVAHAPARRLGIGTDGFGFEEQEEENVSNLNVIENLNISIEGIYDLEGRQVGGMSKGFYLHNGKIILIK